MPRLAIAIPLVSALLLCVCFMPGPSAAAAQEAAPEERPNVLLVLLDDARPEHLRAMPQTRPLLGNAGLRFTRAYAVDPECCPARATILTGKYSHNHGVLGSDAPYAHPAFGAAEGDTIATRLDAAGYETGLVGKYMNLYEGAYVPPGWDFWRAKVGAIGDPGPNYEVAVGRQVMGFERERLSEADYYRRTATEFVVRRRGPWFLTVATPDPHAPYRADPRYAKNYRRAPVPDGVPASSADEWRRSLRSARTADDLIASLISALKQTGQFEDTYVVVTSDNGHTFGEHSYWGKSTPYEESVLVPMLVGGPGVPVGERGGLAGHHDLAPTIADWAGAEPPEGTDGRSLAPLVANASVPWRDALLLEHREPGKTNDWAAVRTAGAVHAEGSYAGDGLVAPPDPTLPARLATLKDCEAGGCRVAEGPFPTP